MLANMVTNVVIVIMFGFYTIAGALDGKCIEHCIHDQCVVHVRGVLLALPGDHGDPRHQADAGGPLGPDHEGHGES